MDVSFLNLQQSKTGMVQQLVNRPKNNELIDFRNNAD
jgi:hypothetical protein